MRLALALMTEADFAAAALPLFEEGTIDAVEWSFDMGWGTAGIPPWLEGLLDDYAEIGWLLGHGVSYSLLGAVGSHEPWLDCLRQEIQRRPYRWVSEHVGFVGAGRFSFSAPLPVPATAEVVALGRQRLAAMREAAGCPVGVENLATCLGVDDALDQGELIRSLLEPVDGFLVLDVHNLWAQSLNTGITFDDLLVALPLDRVRELHLSGGRFGEARGRRVRRDSHDDLVPDELLDRLPGVAARCPSLEVVTYERLGTTLTDRSTHAPFRDDVRRVREVTARLTSGPSAAIAASQRPLRRGGGSLACYQADLLEVLAEGRAGSSAIAALASAHPAYAAAVERFDPVLVEVAGELTRTWGRRPAHDSRSGRIG